MDYQVIDNFLKVLEFKKLQKYIVFNDQFKFTLSPNVAYVEKYHTQFPDVVETEYENWNWYAAHLLYDRVPFSPDFDFIASLVLPQIEKIEKIRALIRIKVNFYGNTFELKEHNQHSDYEYSHKAAILSLNTCDGFTRLENGDKIDSIENRLLIFDGSTLHNSSTTTNQKGRFNINFNWL